MGVQQSREAYRTVNIDQLLRDPEFRDYLKSKAVPAASEESKAYLIGVLRNSSGRQKKDRLRTVQKADTRMPPHVVTTIRDWGVVENIRVFDAVERNPIEAYKALQASSVKRRPSYEEDIVRRLQLCVLFLLRVDAELSSKRAAFANSLHTFVEDDLDTIMVKIRRWTSAGAALAGLAKQLGGYGILLVLPYNIPRSIWETYLSRSTARFTEIVDLFKERGICEVAEQSGAYHAGSMIAQRLGHDGKYGHALD